MSEQGLYERQEREIAEARALQDATEAQIGAQERWDQKLIDAANSRRDEWKARAEAAEAALQTVLDDGGEVTERVGWMISNETMDVVSAAIYDARGEGE